MKKKNYKIPKGCVSLKEEQIPIGIVAWPFMEGKSINEIAKDERITTKEAEDVLRRRIKQLVDFCIDK